MIEGGWEGKCLARRRGFHVIGKGGRGGGRQMEDSERQAEDTHTHTHTHTACTMEQALLGGLDMFFSDI